MTQSSFEILETISESPTTKVYKAHQPSLGRTVLLKMLHKHLAGDADLVNRFEREARACAMLRSEHIVQVYDLEEVDGTPAIVMEYVEGQSLKALLEKEPKQTEEFANTIATGVLKALSIAHKAGVIHRDIKPANILLAEHGTVKVTDFGLASIATAPALTVEGMVLGTPAYMSPEQARGEALTHTTDFFALGVTLLEVVTGEKVFHGESYSECLNKILNFKIEQIDRFGDQFSPKFYQFVQRLMMPAGDERYDSALEALQFLGGGIKLRENGKAAPTKKFTNAYSITALASVLLVMVAALVFYPSGEDNSSGSPKEYIKDSSSQLDSLGGEQKDQIQSDSNATVRTEISREKTEKKISRAEESNLRKEASGAAKPIAAINQIDSGYIQVSCTPWAKVFLGDEYIGTTPIAGTLKVKAGSHQLTFNNPSFLPVIKTVLVEHNTQATVEVNFYDTIGYIFVSVMPWAEVYIDDQHRDTTPLKEPLMVTAGVRKLRLHNPSYEDIITTVNVPSKDTVRLVHSFLDREKK